MDRIGQERIVYHELIPPYIPESMSDPSQHKIISLGDYTFPEAPAINQAEAWFGAIRQRVLHARSKQAVTDDHLSRTDLDTLREFLTEPVCHPLLNSLNERYATAAESESFLELLVIAPCDSTGIVGDWARQHNYDVLQPPSRKALLAEPLPELPALDGKGLLVIPRLEHWFMRHYKGLRYLSKLLQGIRQCKRPVLLSCNSWCWRFLSHVVDAGLILPDPVTFEAFDAHRLRDWVRELSTQDGTDAVQFLDIRDSKDVMQGEGDDISERFTELADLSLGIPWVAWQLWRRSLRTVEQRDVGEGADNVEVREAMENVDNAKSNSERSSAEHFAASPDIKTLWITHNRSPLIPLGRESESHQLLHALLIHDSLSVQELAKVLPDVSESNIMPALIRAGFVEISDDLLRVRASAYPAVRYSLSNANIPQGAI